MPKTRLPNAPEFRRQMIELVRAGRDPEELAREFKPTAQSIRNWVAQADRSEGRHEEKIEPTSSVDREELIKLRREVRQLRLERLDPLRGSSLSKAAAWFARETGAVSSGSSGS
jgi:transposase